MSVLHSLRARLPTAARVALRGTQRRVVGGVRHMSEEANTDSNAGKSSVGRIVTYVAGGTAALLGLGALGYMYTLKAGTAPEEISEDRSLLPKERPKHEVLLLDRQQMFQFGSDKLVDRVELCTVPCNDPFEDRSAVQGAEDGTLFTGVFDGHSGFMASDAVSHFLPSYVHRKLESLSDELAGEKDNSHAVVRIADTIKQAFLEFDEEFVHTVPKRAFEIKDGHLWDAFISPALNGSCAVLGVFRPEGIFVANTGDCRAVLGTHTGHSWGAMDLSMDQTGTTPSEVNRIRNEHPGEESTCVRRGRVLGRLQPSRAFGDARFKWPSDFLEALNQKVIKEYKTPPYVTAEPEVRYIAHRPDHKRFIILATDGIWDVVSSDLAVKLVGQALDKGGSTLNAASHLCAYALKVYAGDVTGGNVDRMMEISPPEARRYRDDITAMVVVMDAKEGSDRFAPPPLGAINQAPTPTAQTLSDVFEAAVNKTAAPGPGA